MSWKLFEFFSLCLPKILLESGCSDESFVLEISPQFSIGKIEKRRSDSHFQLLNFFLEKSWKNWLEIKFSFLFFGLKIFISTKRILLKRFCFWQFFLLHSSVSPWKWTILNVSTSSTVHLCKYIIFFTPL